MLKNITKCKDSPSVVSTLPLFKQNCWISDEVAVKFNTFYTRILLEKTERDV